MFKKLEACLSGGHSVRSATEFPKQKEIENEKNSYYKSFSTAAIQLLSNGIFFFSDKNIRSEDAKYEFDWK